MTSSQGASEYLGMYVNVGGLAQTLAKCMYIQVATAVISRSREGRGVTIYNLYIETTLCASSNHTHARMYTLTHARMHTNTHTHTHIFYIDLRLVR